MAERRQEVEEEGKKSSPPVPVAQLLERSTGQCVGAFAGLGTHWRTVAAQVKLTSYVQIPRFLDFAWEAVEVRECKTLSP